MSSNLTLVVGTANGDLYEYPEGKSGWSQIPRKIVNGSKICVYDSTSHNTFCNLAITALSVMPDTHNNDVGTIGIGTGVKRITTSSDTYSNSISGSINLATGVNFGLGFNFTYTTYSDSVGGQVYYYAAESDGLFWDAHVNTGQSISSITGIFKPDHSDEPQLFVRYDPSDNVSSVTSTTFSIVTPLNPAELVNPEAAEMGAIGMLPLLNNNPTISSAATDYGIFNLGSATGGIRLSEMVNNAAITAIAMDISNQEVFFGLKDGSVCRWAFEYTSLSKKSDLKSGNNSCTNATNLALLNGNDPDITKTWPTSMQVGTGVESGVLFVGYANGKVSMFTNAMVNSPGTIEQLTVLSCSYWSGGCPAYNDHQIIAMDFNNVNIMSPNETFPPSLAVVIEQPGPYSGNEHPTPNFAISNYTYADNVGIADDGTTWQRFDQMSNNLPAIDHLATFIDSTGNEYIGTSYSDPISVGMYAYAYKYNRAVSGDVNAGTLTKQNGSLNDTEFLNGWSIAAGTDKCPLGDISSKESLYGYALSGSPNEITSVWFQEDTPGEVYLYSSSSSLSVTDTNQTYLYQMTPVTLRVPLSGNKPNENVSPPPMFTGYGDYHSTEATYDRNGPCDGN